MEDNHFILSILYLFHMTASVVWAGGMLLVFFDNRRQALSPEVGAIHLKPRQRKLVFLGGWFCLAIIGATGMFQMSASTSYEGFLAINNAWSQALLVKHLIVIVFLGLLAYVTQVLEAQIERAVLRAKKTGETSSEWIRKAAGRQNQWLIALGVLFFLILVFTSLARAS